MQDDRSKNRGKAVLLSAFPRFRTYVKFAEYYKSVTKINCHVGKSFVSQL
jgi:hypothetical protein